MLVVLLASTALPTPTDDDGTAELGTFPPSDCHDGRFPMRAAASLGPGREAARRCWAREDGDGEADGAGRAAGTRAEAAKVLVAGLGGVQGRAPASLARSVSTRR